jgi:inner membrane protein
MDTLSHAAVSLAVAALSGHQPALRDPIYIATMLGAQAPDFDIIAQARGNMAYLRQHRCFSHSIPGITAWSLAVALLTAAISPGAALGQAFLWSFAGGLSHICLDYFNTHGVAILWPFRKIRLSFPLLNVFDPILFALMLAPHIFQRQPLPYAGFSLALLAAYILSRCLLRRRALRRLAERFSDQEILRMWLMPSLRHLFHWDFVVETRHHNLNGRLGILSPRLKILADLPRREPSQLTQLAQDTALGQFFLTFTPFTHFAEGPDDEVKKVEIYDLRYFADQHFIHSGTVLFNHNDLPSESYIHSLGRTAKFQPAV